MVLDPLRVQFQLVEPETPVMTGTSAILSRVMWTGRRLQDRQAALLLPIRGGCVAVRRPEQTVRAHGRLSEESPAGRSSNSVMELA